MRPSMRPSIRPERCGGRGVEMVWVAGALVEEGAGSGFKSRTKSTSVGATSGLGSLVSRCLRPVVRMVDWLVFGWALLCEAV